MKLPIFDSRDGRTVIGHAEGVRTATVALRKILTVPAGFNLYVWQRKPEIMDCLDFPAGFVYSISKRY
jgi:hypothetical protein